MESTRLNPFSRRINPINLIPSRRRRSLPCNIFPRRLQPRSHRSVSHIIIHIGIAHSVNIRVWLINRFLLLYSKLGILFIIVFNEILITSLLLPSGVARDHAPLLDAPLTVQKMVLRKLLRNKLRCCSSGWHIINIITSVIMSARFLLNRLVLLFDFSLLCIVKDLQKNGLIIGILNASLIKTSSHRYLIRNCPFTSLTSIHQNTSISK